MFSGYAATPLSLQLFQLFGNVMLIMQNKDDVIELRKINKVGENVSITMVNKIAGNEAVFIFV